MASLLTHSEPTNLRQFELSYLTYFQVIKLLLQELILMPVIWGNGVAVFFMTWWIYALQTLGVMLGDFFRSN